MDYINRNQPLKILNQKKSTDAAFLINETVNKSKEKGNNTLAISWKLAK